MTETAKMSRRLCDAQGVSLGCFLLTSLRSSSGTDPGHAHTRWHAHSREHLRGATSERASERARGGGGGGDRESERETETREAKGGAL